MKLKFLVNLGGLHKEERLLYPGTSSAAEGAVAQETDKPAATLERLLIELMYPQTYPWLVKQKHMFTTVCKHLQ